MWRDVIKKHKGTLSLHLPTKKFKFAKFFSFFLSMPAMIYRDISRNEEAGS